MIDRYITKTWRAGQSVLEAAPLTKSARWALLCALVLAFTGCTSIYHRTGSRLPSSPAAEAELRIAEARKADDLARQAGKKLLSHLRQAKPELMIVADFDRLEAAAFELERRALAARDQIRIAGTGNPDSGTGIETWLSRAQSWLTYTQTQRANDQAAQIRQLEILLDPAQDGGAGGR